MNQLTTYKNANQQQAGRAAVMLCANYTALKLENPDAFMLALRNLYMEFPSSIIERANVHIPKVLPKYKFDLFNIRAELLNLAKPIYSQLKLEKEQQISNEKQKQIEAKGAAFTKEANEWQALNPGKRLREMAKTYREPTPMPDVKKPTGGLPDNLQARVDAAGEGAVLRAGLEDVKREFEE